MLHRDFDLAHVLAPNLIFDDGQVIADGILDVLNSLLLRCALGPAARQARNRNSETFLRLLQSDAVFHANLFLTTGRGRSCQTGLEYGLIEDSVCTLSAKVRARTFLFPSPKVMIVVRDPWFPSMATALTDDRPRRSRRKEQYYESQRRPCRHVSDPFCREILLLLAL